MEQVCSCLEKVQHLQARVDIDSLFITRSIATVSRDRDSERDVWKRFMDNEGGTGKSIEANAKTHVANDLGITKTDRSNQC